MKSFNVLILSCDSSPLANTRAPHVLHRNIIRPVFVGLRVAIELQKRQYTVRSHGSRAVNLLTTMIRNGQLYIAPKERTIGIQHPIFLR